MTDTAFIKAVLKHLPKATIQKMFKAASDSERRRLSSMVLFDEMLARGLGIRQANHAFMFCPKSCYKEHLTICSSKEDADIDLAISEELKKRYLALTGKKLPQGGAPLVGWITAGEVRDIYEDMKAAAKPKR